MEERPRPRLFAYGIALLAPAASLLIRWPLWPVLGDAVPHMTFFPAVMIAAHFGGFWPGVLATILSAVGANYFLTEQLREMRITSVNDVAAVLLFVLTGTIISGLSESLHRAQHRIVADERRRAREAVREAQEWFRQMAENIHEIFWVADLEHTRFFYISPGYEEVWGQPRQSFYDQPQSWIETIHPDDRAKVVENAEQHRRGIFNDGEFRIIRPDGSVRWIRSRAFPMKDPDGSLLRIAGLAEDITERKRAESELRISEQRFRTFVDHATDAFFLFDEKYVIRDVNRQACQSLGYTREELLGMTPRDFDPDVTSADLEQIKRKLGELELFTFESRHRRKDGTVFPVEVKGQTFWEGGRRLTVALARDNTERKRAEEALRRSAALMRLSDDAIAVWKLDGGIESWSRGAEQLYGFAEDEALGRATHELLRTVFPVPWPEIEAKLLAGGSWEGELHHRTKDGRAVIVSTRMQSVRDDNAAWRVLESSRDITDRKRAEALLDGQKRILELIIQGDPLADVLAVLCRTIEELSEGEVLASILLLDADGVHLRTGAAPSLPEGYTRAIDGIAIGPSVGSCGTAAFRREPVYVSDIADDPLWAPYVDVALAHGLRACWSLPILASTGEVLGTFAMYYRQPRHPTPRDLRVVDLVTRTVAIAVEQRRAEQALRVSEERFRTLAKATNDAVWDWDLGTNRVWWNEGVFTLFGCVLHQNEAEPAWWLERVHPDDREAVRTFFYGVVHGREPSWVDEYRFRCADGSYKDVYDRGYVIRDDDGRAVRMIGAMLDITARKRAEEALRESEQRWRNLAEALPQLVWTATPDGACDYFSTQWTQHTGVTEGDLLGWRWLAVLHPDDRDATRQRWADAVAGRGAYDVEYRVRRSDGEYRWFKTRGVPIRDSEGDVFKWFGTCTDITTDKQHEEELRLANERLDLAVRGSNIAIWENDMADGNFGRGRVYHVNVWEQLGYERPDFPPDQTRISDTAFHPDDHAAVQEAIRRYLAGDTDKFELEHRLRHKDGSYRWMLTRGMAVRDAGGKPIRFVGSAVDITDRKRLEEELRQAKEAAEAANRAKDEFLANVSHEIRTPMNAILGMTELVLDTPLGDDQRQSLRTVKSAADNLLGIINDLLDFSKIEAGRLELDAGDFSLRAAVGDTLRALAMRAHRKGLELVCNVRQGVPDALVGDAGRLRQVLLNLVGNAIKFTDRGEVVMQVDGAADPSPDGDVTLRFAVHDTGIGIPREKQSAIFRAFEQEDTSTTRKYGGTGLGLTISAQLAALMGGSIAVESEVGRGSTFSFTARFGVQAHPPLAVTTAPPGLLHNLRVLVVDDNAVNRQIMEQWLRDWQMEPTSVGDGMAAMDALWHGVAVGMPHALLLLDARMPDTDGLALAAKIRERAELSGSRILLLASGDRPGDLARLRELGVDGHLLKPVQQDELLETIYSIMSRPSGNGGAPKRHGPPPGARPVTPRAVAPLRVLVAEDSEFNAQLMEKLLATRGHTVRVAGNGREALALASTAEVDLLFLDVHMPELDGFEVIRAIRERERTTGTHLPVIALTARSRKEDRERCLAAGMDDFLAKPIQVDALWSTVERVSAAFPSPNRNGRGLLDPRVLMAACGGDPAILRGICDGLCAHLPADLAAVRDALESQNAPRLRESAHKLSGMVAAFSTVAGGIASDLEACATRGRLDEARPLVDEMQAVGRELMQQVGSTLTIESLRLEAAGSEDSAPSS